jgi:hypothetical protein
MTWMKNNSNGNQQIGRYATEEEFRQIFSEDMDDLYQMSFLLTVTTRRLRSALLPASENVLRQTKYSKNGVALGRT